MDSSYTNVLELTLKKVEEKPELANDLITYLKVLAVKYCPEDKLEEMKLLFKNGNLSVFYDFLDQFLPNLPKIVLDYVRAY